MYNRALAAFILLIRALEQGQTHRARKFKTVFWSIKAERKILVFCGFQKAAQTKSQRLADLYIFRLELRYCLKIKDQHNCVLSTFTPPFSKDDIVIVCFFLLLQVFPPQSKKWLEILSTFDILQQKCGFHLTEAVSARITRDGRATCTNLRSNKELHFDNTL